MAKVYEFLANGFEEIEALAPVDILRRGGVEVHTVSVTGSEFVESSHGITIKADLLFTRPEDYRDADLLMIPGGMPGSTNLNAHEGVRQAMLWQYNSGRRVAAICAAPMVLGGIGILNGKRLPAHRDSRNISPGPPIRHSSTRRMATSSQVKDRQLHCPMPIASSAISSVRRKCASCKRRCSTLT